MNLKNSTGINCKAVALSTVLNYYEYPLSEAMCFGLGASLDFSFSEVRFRKGFFTCVSGNNNNDYNYIAQLLKLKYYVKKFANNDQLKEYINKKMIEEVPLIAGVSIDKYINILTEKYLPQGEEYGRETKEIFKIIQTPVGIHVAVISNIGQELIQLYEQNLEKPVIIPWKTYTRASNPKTMSVMHPANAVYSIEPTVPFDRIKGKMDWFIAKAISDNMRNYLFANNDLYGIDKILQTKEWILSSLRSEGNHNELMLFPFFCDTITGGGFYRRMYSRFLEEVDRSYFGGNVFKDDIKSYKQISWRWTKVSRALKNALHDKENIDQYIDQIDTEIEILYQKEYDAAEKLLEKGEAYLNVY